MKVLAAVVIFVWIALLITHPVATLVISGILGITVGACALGGRQGDQSNTHR